MNKMFVSGSLSGKELPIAVKQSLTRSMLNNDTILIGDARGIDKNVQNFLSLKKYENVIIYYVGNKPRNLENENWKTLRIIIDENDPALIKNNKILRAGYAEKDKKMASDADFGLVIWDDVRKTRFGNLTVSKGSLNNIVNLLINNKPVGVYHIPTPSKGIMKFKKLKEFEDEVIKKLVDIKTAEYYKKIKKEHLNKKVEQINLF